MYLILFLGKVIKYFILEEMSDLGHGLFLCLFFVFFFFFFLGGGGVVCVCVCEVSAGKVKPITLLGL